MRAGILWLAVCLISSPLLAAGDAFTSGLKHSIITNAVFSTDAEAPLSVINTGYPEEGGTNTILGLFGASIHLGAADAGVFVSVSCDREDGWAMDGVSHGTVGGVTNSPIGTVTGTRNGFGWYEVHMDFSPIGSTTYTYQLFFHDLKTLEVTNAGPDSVVDVGSYGANNPRINPIWRDGNRVGAVVDFDYQITEFNVPGFHTYASRMIILAENPTNTVGQIEQVDVFGRNGLPEFTIQNERLGKFGLYHQSIGAVRFHAAPSQLTVSNIDTSALQGMFTELPRVQKFRASLVPRDLASEPFTFLASFSGSSSLTQNMKFLGDMMLSRESNVVSLSVSLGGIGDGITRVLNQGALVGSFAASNGVIGIIHGTNLVLSSYAAAATQTNEPAYIGMGFGNPVTLSNAAGALLTGDEIRISTTPPEETIEAVTAIAFTGLNLDHLTITGIETLVLPTEPLRLKFARAGDNLRLSWLYTPDFYLAAKFELPNSTWEMANHGTYTVTNSQAWFETSMDYGSTRFFELKHYYSDFLVTPVVIPDRSN